MKIGMKLVLVMVIFLTIIIGGCGTSSSASANSGNSPSVSVSDELDLAIRDASDYLNDNIPKGSMIVILNIQSDSASLSDYVIDELIANAVNDKIFKVVDRRQLDLIRAEQNFQLSGEVDDKLAVSIGKVFGAQTIVSGKVVQVGERYRMTIRALEVQTAQVQGQYNRNIVAGKTITALMKSGSSAIGTQVSTTGTTGSRTSGNTSSGETAAKVVPTVTGVIISPDSVSVDKGKTQQFSAIISGTNNPEQTVTWTVTDNTSRETNISAEGVLTVGNDESITPLTVIATSKVDISKKGSVTVVVPGGISALNVNSVSEWNNAINKIRNGGNNQTYIINVTGNVSVPVPPNNENLFGSLTGISVTLQGNGIISPSSKDNLLRIGIGQMVIVKGNLTLRGRSDSVVLVNSGAYFKMEGNASITGNTTGGQGGGVYVNGGNFVMEGGIISGNTASVGGGVFVASNGTFTMEGGTISGNTAGTAGSGEGGGGVAIGGMGLAAPQSQGNFIMKGGTISGNTANTSSYGGGGVSLNWFGSTFTMEGGTISGNVTSGYGGGVYIGRGNKFTKTGGIITGNDTVFGNRNTAKKGHAVSEGIMGSHWRNVTAGSEDSTTGFGFWLND